MKIWSKFPIARWRLTHVWNFSDTANSKMTIIKRIAMLKSKFRCHWAHNIFKFRHRFIMFCRNAINDITTTLTSLRLNHAGNINVKLFFSSMLITITTKLFSFMMVWITSRWQFRNRVSVFNIPINCFSISILHNLWMRATLTF